MLIRFNTESYGENDGAWRFQTTPAGMRQKRNVQSNLSTASLSKPSFALWSHSLRACYRLPRENKHEGSRTFNVVYRFLHIQMSSWIRNKAKTLRWDPSERVLGRFDV